MTIWVLGAGRMGGALIHGWCSAHIVAPSDLVIFDPHPGPEALAAVESGAALNPDINSAPKPSLLLLAVKPQIWREAVTPIAPHLAPDTVILSVAAGVRLSTLAHVFGDRPLVRTMPNTPAAIGQGVTAYVLGPHTDRAVETEVKRLLAPLGLVEKLSDESLIDAVAAVSGSGPAYVFFLVEALAAAGVGAGLTEAQAMRLARQTIIGSGAMLAHDDQTVEALRKAVTSPNGTTQAALDAMMEGGGLFALMRRAVEANIRRSIELGKS